MTRAKNISDSDKSEEESGQAKAEKPKKGDEPLVKTSESANAKTPVPAATQPKKPLGVKEVIPFGWKLVGVSHGVALTLYKAVERDDVEAQCHRAGSDGYYKQLRVLEIDAKVVQPTPPVRQKAAKSVKKPAKAPKKVAPKAPKAKHTKKTAPSRKRPAAKKASGKTAAKTAKKKTTPAKKTAKRSTTKKK